jgi:hypothetical protein
VHVGHQAQAATLQRAGQLFQGSGFDSHGVPRQWMGYVDLDWADFAGIPFPSAVPPSGQDTLAGPVLSVLE